MTIKKGLEEVREVIDLSLTDPSGVRPKQKALALLRAHLADTDKKAPELAEFRAELAAHINASSAGFA